MNFDPETYDPFASYDDNRETHHRINQIRAKLGHSVVMPDDWLPMAEFVPQSSRPNAILKALAGEMLRWRIGYWKEAGLQTDTTFFPEYDEANLAFVQCLFAVCYGNPARIPLRRPNDWKQVARQVFSDNETGCGVHEAVDCDSFTGSEIFAYLRGDYVCVFKCCPACLKAITDPDADPANFVGLFHEDSVPLDANPWG